MKIFIAHSNFTPENSLEDIKLSFIQKFKEVRDEDFVNDNPDVFWFLTGDVEPNVLKFIKPDKRYCLLASPQNNSWSAASEVKAYCNEKGVKTKIFDFNLLTSIDQIQEFLDTDYHEKENTRLGIIGEKSNSLVVSYPDEELLKDILHIEILNISEDELENPEDFAPDPEMYSKLKDKWNPEIEKSAKLLSAIKVIINKYNLDAVTLNCFDFIRKKNLSPCLAFAFLNSENFPAACETDLCAAAAMIVGKRLISEIPWMTNLTHVDDELASFAHCSVPLNMVDDFEIVRHCASEAYSSVKAELTKEQVTVFRIDRKLEHCFIARGIIKESGKNINSCRTSVKISLSSKSLFLLREFPLGNHHMIVKGNQSDILAKYFTEKGFRIF